MAACTVQALGVRQQIIIPDFARPSSNTSAFDLSIQHLFGQSSVRHSADMTKPPKPLHISHTWLIITIYRYASRC